MESGSHIILRTCCGYLQNIGRRVHPCARRVWALALDLERYGYVASIIVTTEILVKDKFTLIATYSFLLFHPIEGSGLKVNRS